MDRINLWESSFAKYFTFSNDLNTLLELIKEGQEITVKDSYFPGDLIENHLEHRYSEQNIILNYNDEEHPMALTVNNLICQNNISTAFFNKHKDVIIEALTNYILNSNNLSIAVSKIVFSDELFEKILENKNHIYYFHDIDLSSEQIKKLNDNFVYARMCHYNSNVEVSTDRVIGDNSMKEINENVIVYIPYDISDRDLENLKYLKDNTRIKITCKTVFELPENEDEYYLGTQKIINKMESLGKNNLVTLEVYHRSAFAKYKFNVNNVKLIVLNDNTDYAYSTYLKEEEKLDKLIEDIKNSSMSPFEQYLAVYNIVKNYKPYKENEVNKDESRDLKYILDGEYMVCVGYAKLLITLLDKIGIKAIHYGTAVSVGKVDEKTKENHARVMVNLIDDKYGINGYYISDPTWDNNLNKDYYNYAVVNYDSMQVSKDEMELKELDLIFDVHNFDEYCTKINMLLNIKCRQYRNSNYNETEKVYEMYYDVCYKIMDTLCKIDSEVYHQLSALYEKTNNDKIQATYNLFLTEVGNLIVPKANKTIANETIINAALASKKLDSMEDLEHKKIELLKEKEEIDQKVFPYEISDEGHLVHK